MAKRIMKYNPAFLEQHSLVDSFVVRHADLDLIMGVISENVTDSNQHILVIGPRGSGKTTLVLRVVAEIDRDQELKGRWHPLVFAEESYEVVSAGEFWLEALFHLAEQTGEEKWRRTYAEIKEERDEQRLRERALAQLLDFADSQGKRLLLVVENLNMLFADMTSPDEAWKIRHTLMNEPRLMLLATATSRFETIDNTSQAMFEMFKIQELKPLNDRECNTIWASVAGRELLGERIRPIRILTGGNPRLLTIIAKFGAHRSFRQLLDDLVDLIDDHTEYFKSHLDSLPTIERKAYLALAGLWDASTARDIAKAARLDVSKTSSLLARLVNRGAVLVEEHSKKVKWYMVAERMYNIYYLMRRRGKPADRVRAAVRFMVSMYDPESAARLISEEACRLNPDLCRDHFLAYGEMIQGLSSREQREKVLAVTPATFLESPYLSEAVRSLISSDRGGAQDESGSTVENELQGILDLLSQWGELFKEGKHEEALRLIEAANEKFSLSMVDADFQLEAIILHGKGMTLGTLGRHEEEIAVYDQIVSRFADDNNSLLQEMVAYAMVAKTQILIRFNRLEEAIGAFDQILVRLAATKKLVLCEIVARAMVGKGETLERLNRPEEAIDVYDEIFKRFVTTKSTIVRKMVVTAMVAKGELLDRLNRSEESISLYDGVVTHYAKSKELTIQEEVAQALFNKGCILDQLNRPQEAIEALDEVVRRFVSAEHSALRVVVAGAMNNKGAILCRLNRLDEAIEICDQLVEYLHDSKEGPLQGMLITALANKVNTLIEVRRYEEAVLVIRQALEVQPDLPGAATEVIELMLKFGRTEDVLKIAEDYIAQRPTDVDLLNGIAWALYVHGDFTLLLKAAEWTKQALSLVPDNGHVLHTLTCILCALGKGEEALASASCYLQDTALIEQSLDDAIEVCVALAAAGQAREVLAMLTDSPAAQFLEPMVVGLKLYLGEEVKTAAEIREVAGDVVQRIEARVTGQGKEGRA